MSQKRSICNLQYVAAVLMSYKISKPRRIVDWSNNTLSMEILVKALRAMILPKAAHFVATKRAIVTESKVTIDPYGAGSD